MLALLDALLEDKADERETTVTSRFDTDEQGRRIVAWKRDGAYTPDGDGVFDIGNATGAAIRSLESGTPAEPAGGTGEMRAGTVCHAYRRSPSSSTTRTITNSRPWPIETRG